MLQRAGWAGIAFFLVLLVGAAPAWARRGEGKASCPAVGCVKGEACRSSIVVGRDGKRVPIFSTRPLGVRDPSIKLAIVVVHGQSRHASSYFESLAKIARRQCALDRTVVVAPYYQTIPGKKCNGVVDHPAEGELFWSCRGWKHGENAENGSGPEQSSFGVLDAIVAQLKQSFPQLGRIIITGHSAGGQVTQRYAAANRAADTPPLVAMRYVIANPSSYVYFDNRRLRKDAVCAGAAGCALSSSSFAPYWDAGNCKSFDQHPYGLRGRRGYMATVSDEQLAAQYVKRDVVYLLGEADSGNAPEAMPEELDVRCAAVAEGPYQGSFRLQRGLTYYRYITQLYGARHRLEIAPGCGHKKTCMYGSPQGLAALFQ